MTFPGTRLRDRSVSRWAVAAFALAGLIAGCSSIPRESVDADDKPDFAAMEELVRREMKAAEVPGLSLAIIRDGEVVYRGAFGVKSVETGEPITIETLFEAASLSKPVFAYFVMLQVDKGLLDLDRPLYEYLPNQSLVDDPRHEKLTARMVLAHASGLPNWRVDTGGELKLLFEPGTRFGYSGEGYEYLKQALKQVLDTDDDGLQALFDAEVSRVIGARFMKYTWDESIPSLKAFGHRKGVATDNHRHDRNFGASYSLHTTPLDYARFLSMLIRPDAGNAGTVERLLAIQYGLPHEDDELHRSLGFPVKMTEKGPRYYHSGNNGDFRAYCHFYPEQGDGIVLFGNSDNLFSSNLAKQIVEHLGDKWFYM